MICKFYSNSRDTFETRDIRAYITRTRRPTSTSNDGMGPILHYGPNHSLVYTIYLNGRTECHHVK